MKSAILSIAAVAFGLPLALARSELEMAMKSVLDDLRPGHSLRFEEDIPQQCIDEVIELEKNTDLLIAFNGLTCSLESDGETSIKIDFNRCSSGLGEVQLACTSAGGKYRPASFAVVCSANGRKISVSAIDMPECWGKSCDMSLEDPEAENELAKFLEEGLLAEGIYASCEGLSESPAESPASAIVFSKVAMAGGMLGLLINLL